MRELFIFILLTLSLCLLNGQTNKEIIDKLIEMDKRLIKVETKLEEIDKRFEQIDKRFEQIDKRFEQIDKRFEQIDKRFEQMDKRFGDMFSFLIILATIFTGMTVSTIGFAVWDRRSMIKPFEYKVKEIERKIEITEKDLEENKLVRERLVKVLNEYAKEHKDFAKILENSGF